MYSFVTSFEYLSSPLSFCGSFISTKFTFDGSKSRTQSQTLIICSNMNFLLFLMEDTGSFCSLIYCFIISMISIVMWWICLCMISMAFICYSKSCLLDLSESNFVISVLSAFLLSICINSSSSRSVVCYLAPSSTVDSPWLLACYEAASEFAVRLAVPLD